MKKNLIIIGVLILALVILLGCKKKQATGVGPANIVVWGLDDNDSMQGIISSFQKARPGSTVTYKKFNDIKEYESVLINEIAEGKGPDVFYFHNTWLPRHVNKVVPLVSEFFTPAMFKETYVRVAAQDMMQPDPADGVEKIYSLPLYVDTLALYNNKDFFERKLPERGKPAELWSVFQSEAARFTDQDSESGALTRGAIAFGDSANINNATDILYSLFLQAEASLYDKNFKQLALKQSTNDAFDYYLSYSKKNNKNFSWSPDDFFTDGVSKSGNEEAFLSGKVASMMAYSDFAHDLGTKIKNVKSKVGNSISESDVAVVPSPQFSGSEADHKAFANYWGLSVSRTSKIPNTAWDFVRFAGSQPQLKLYVDATGRPTSRRDLISEQRGRPLLEAFVQQLGFADSYRLFDKVRFDEEVAKAIDNAAGGQSSKSALDGVQDSMNQLLKLQAPKGLYPPVVIKKK